MLHMDILEEKWRKGNWWTALVTLVHMWGRQDIIYLLLWRHNERVGVSNHRCLDCLFNCLFRRRSNKTSKPRVTGLWGEFIGHRWILRTKGQFREKCFHLMTSSCSSYRIMWMPAVPASVSSKNNGKITTVSLNDLGCHCSRNPFHNRNHCGCMLGQLEKALHSNTLFIGWAHTQNNL